MRDTVVTGEGHILVRDFARRHELGTRELGDLLCVATSTIRRYKSAPGAHMHRALNPVARRLIEWFDARPETLRIPIAREWPLWTNADFAKACGGRGDIEVGAALGVARQTAFRWRRELPVPATAAKLTLLYRAFGWPAPMSSDIERAAISSG
jgi:hypothetical protein